MVGKCICIGRQWETSDGFFFSNSEGLTFQSFIEATVALVRSGDLADLSCFQVFFTHSACHLHAQLAVLSPGSDLAPNAITE